MKTKVFNYFKKFIQDIQNKFNNPVVNMRRNRKIQAFAMAAIRTILLAGLCFVILFPTIQQILQALRAPEDVNNPAVIWIPETWSVLNIKIAAMVLDYKDALINTAKLSFISMFLQIASTALAGYAFSRLKFKGSNILFILVILTIIVPPQALSLAQYFYFRDFRIGILEWVGISTRLLGKEGSIYLMSGLGMGIRSGIFIYIFRSFFRGLPKELEESAIIDGASVFRTFWSVMLPNARGALVTVGLFAFVWQWNDAYYVKIFEVSTANFPLLTMRLLNAAEGMYASLFYTGALNLIGQDVWANPVFLALISNVSALLMMLPLLIMYLFVQKSFVESIERTGIVG